MIAEEKFPLKLFAQLLCGALVCFAACLPELGANQVRHPKLLLHPKRQGFEEGTETGRSVVEIGLEETIEFQQGLVVEANVVELIGCYACFAQAVANRVKGKIVVVLDAGESLFLRRGHDFAVNDQAGSGIVIESGDAKNADHASASGLEQGVDKWRNGRTLCQNEQSANQHQRDHDGRQPILLVLSHELPEFPDNLHS